MQPFGTVAGRLRRHLARWFTLDRALHRLLLPFLSPAQPAGLSGHIRSPVREGRHNRMGVPHPASLRRDPGAFSNSWLATATLWPSPTTAFLLSKTAASLFDWRDCAQHSQRKIMTMDAVPSSCGASYSTCYLPAQYPPVRHSGQPFPYSKPPMCRQLLAVSQAPADSHNPADTDVPRRLSSSHFGFSRTLLARRNSARPRL